jgi:hypothetical protein
MDTDTKVCLLRTRVDRGAAGATGRESPAAPARSLIEPAGGEIAAEFFDIGLSRSLPSKRRPEALRLLDTIKSPARDFDAVFIGGPQRMYRV